MLTNHVFIRFSITLSKIGCLSIFYLMISDCMYSLCTNFFSLDERKMDRVLLETERNRQMANQIARKTFTASHSSDKSVLPTGPQVVELKADYYATLQLFLSGSC